MLWEVWLSGFAAGMLCASSNFAQHCAPCRPPKGLGAIYGDESPVAQVAPQVTVILGSILGLYIAKSLVAELTEIFF